jgi:hypothetical protein
MKSFASGSSTVTIRLRLLISFCLILGDKAALVTAISNPKQNDATIRSQLCCMKFFILFT